MNMEKLNIVLADDHRVVREGIRSLLEDEEDICVVGEAGGGLEAVQLVENLKPQIAILDMMMKDINGIEVTRQVVKRSPSTRVIILSMYANEVYVVEALKAGALAYVLKESSSAELAQAVRAVATGHRYLSAQLSERAIEVYMRAAQEETMDEDGALTPREREVLHMAAQGYTNAQIASYLFIGQRTVETHRNNIMRKLGLRNQTDLIRYALKHEIIPMEE
ncbi:MAG: response regulator transcription factor [Dehalococcoidia bacterium]